MWDNQSQHSDQFNDLLPQKKRLLQNSREHIQNGRFIKQMNKILISCEGFDILSSR